MQTLSLAEVPQTGTVPNVDRLRVRARIVSAKPGETKKKEPKFDLGLEIFSPEKIKDADGKIIVIAGAKVTLSLMFDGKGKAGTAQFHDKMGLPLEVSADSPEEFNQKMQELYMGNNLAVELFLSSEPATESEYSESEGKAVPVTDDNGNPVVSGFRWKTIWSSNVVGKTEDPNAV